MTSKEALERLYDGYQHGMNGRSLYDIISQDLERLEELKKVINKEYTHWKRIKYNDEMNGHSNNTADYCVEFLSFLKEVLGNE